MSAITLAITQITPMNHGINFVMNSRWVTLERRRVDAFVFMIRLQRLVLRVA